jgi:ribosome-associated protein YbcJ (S4-like RNA binding protein)
MAQAVGGEAIGKLHERLVKMAQERGVVKGRKMRVDTTVDVATFCYTSLSL